MKQEEFAQLLGDLDERHIREAETYRKAAKPFYLRWSTAAACLCLAAALAGIGPGLFRGSPAVPGTSAPAVPSEPRQTQATEPTEAPHKAWTIRYNTATGLADAAKLHIPGYFTQELDREALAAVVPAQTPEDLEISGYAGFNGSGDLIQIHLTVTAASRTEVEVTVSTKDGLQDCYILAQPAATSLCGNTEYTAYRWDLQSGYTLLAAEASINGYAFAWRLQAPTPELARAEADFARVLEWFSGYSGGSPDLTVIEADEIPEWFDYELSLQEALTDPTYGAYMLRSLPEGFRAESIRRYRDQTSDYLTGLWTRGYDELQWRVSSFADTDASRLTGIADTENYDLSLYPIPRADSVPEELWEIVNDPIFSAEELTLEAVWARAYKTGETGDSSGWRMAFSVKYGDILVEVHAKGVDPEWVYQQLMLLNEP